jgi:hypothetical protein
MNCDYFPTKQSPVRLCNWNTLWYLCGRNWICITLDCSWCRWLVATVSLGSPASIPGPDRVVFLVHKVAREYVFPQVFPFFPASIFPPMLLSQFTFIRGLLLLGQVGESWVPGNRAVLFSLWESIGEKLFSHVWLFSVFIRRWNIQVYWASTFFSTWQRGLVEEEVVKGRGTLFNTLI